jgi:hypothetical protein
LTNELQRWEWNMKRLIIAGVAGTAALLTAGGVAYAVGSEPSPETGYVEVVDPTPGQGQGQGQDGRDCPEKGGTGNTTPDESSPNQSSGEL